MEVPYGKLFEWIADDTERMERYVRAKRLWAGSRADKVSVIADALDGEPTKGQVSAAKVQIDANLKLAKIWDRERYGDQVSIDGRVTRDPATQDRDTMLLELARSVAFVFAAVKRREAPAPMAALPAPEREVSGTDTALDEDPI